MPLSLHSAIPSGPLDQKWTRHKMDSRLINPVNKRKFSVIVVGSGLAGGAAAATLSKSLISTSEGRSLRSWLVLV